MAAPMKLMKGAMYREVTAPATNSARWKSITICTGASASTLQDIKVSESSGGYAYLPASDVRNRFIYWRTYQDVVELVEESLDTTLSGNMVRYRFQDSPVLPNISVHEVHGTVIVLVTTVASVHRLVFPHPSKMARQQTFVLSEQVSTSIFYDASLPDDPRNQFLLTPGGSINAQLVRATSCVTPDDHALFAMATSTGSLLLVKMPPVGVTGVVLQQELSCSSVMKKLWNGLIPGAMRGSQAAVETAQSLEMVFLGGDVYVFTVCRDYRLRVWSTKTRECVLTENLMFYTGKEMEEPDSSAPTYTGSSNVLKAVLGGNSNSICVCLSLQKITKFIFLTPTLKNGRVKMEHLVSLDKSPLEDLVDFVVTEDILLSLWTTQAGETQVLSLPISQSEESKVCEWEAVYLAQTSDSVIVTESCDPREVFLAKIFSPGAFAPQDIIKALSVYLRCAAPIVESDSLLNASALREEVTNAVDSEIRNSVSDYEVQEEAYMDLQRQEWEKLYSCCCQYKQVGEKAKGLFADPVTGLFGIIKKSTLSLLRPCDRTEMLYLSPTISLSETVVEEEGLAADDMSPAVFAKDLRLLCDAIQLISAHIEPELAIDFYLKLQSLQNPDELIDKLSDLLRLDNQLVNQLTGIVNQMRDPVFSVEAMFNMLQVSDDLTLDMMDSSESSGHAHYSHLYCGNLGLAVLTQSFLQLVQLRFNLTRDLTLFLSMVNQFGVNQDITQNVTETGLYLLRCYKMVVWAAESLTSASSSNTFDMNLRQLSNLEITDKSVGRPLAQIGSESSYLMRMFLGGIGGDAVRSRLAAQGEGSAAVWSDDLNQFVLSLVLLIWPASEESILLEFLVRSCQYLRVEELSHLLNPWCTWNEASRAFFLGLAYLHFDEGMKAMQMFKLASDGVATESFLVEKLLQTDETDFCKLQILYYLKVIKHLEEHGLPDLVISMATYAISKAQPDDPNLPTLQSKIFMQHLELGHNKEAFTAMMGNSDKERRKDCLHQFLVVLCERRNLNDLITLDYGDLEEEVVYILEKRARSVDLSTHDYYNLLFSYFVHREDFRKAGRVMFERGLRLSQEVPGLNSLKQQAQSYLAALNTLHLVQPDYAWIIKPVLRPGRHGEEEVDAGSGQRLSGKHGLDGRSKDRSSRRKLQILELADLQREYLLLDARLRLIHNKPDSPLVSGPMPSPQELLSLLCSAGLYDVAMSITHAFSMSSETVLASLALRCVSMATQTATTSIRPTAPSSMSPISSASFTSVKSTGQDSKTDPYQWLRENSIPPCGAREVSPADKAWSLLQSYLSMLEDGSGQSHRCICHTLLAQGFLLPEWLIDSYKRLDVSALLRVYLTYNLLNQAASLAINYLEGVTESLVGADEPAFNIKGLTSDSPQSVWIPYTCIDQLMVALRETNKSTHSAMYQRMKDKLDAYQTKSYDVSHEISAY